MFVRAFDKEFYVFLQENKSQGKTIEEAALERELLEGIHSQ